jgi:16S rRNA (guanine527-N7)-methyltransferase
MGTVSRETLAELAAEHQLPAAAADQFARLLEALADEPDPHTTVSDPARALDVHLRDSLAALAVPTLPDAATVVDVGSGAGFPGLPLAVALPAARFDLVESASRKTAVIGRLAAAAGLANVRPVRARVEEWARAEVAHADGAHAGDGAALGGGRAAYDVATARAVAPLAVLVEYAAPLLRRGGTFIAWKGTPDADEVEAGDSAAAEVGLGASEPLAVTPYRGAHGLHLYLYSKVRDTPGKYPRRPGMAAKRPLGA